MSITLDVAPGVHRIHDRFVSFYLVEDDSGITLIDAGLKASWPLFTEAVAKAGRQLSDVKGILLTHGHFDHVGFTEKARSELGIPVWIGEGDRRKTRMPFPLLYKFEKPLPFYLANKGVIKTLVQIVFAKGFTTKPVKEVQTLVANGKPMDLPGGPIPIHTPGHTIGHHVFHLPDRDCVIAGDSIGTVDPYTGKTGPRPIAKGATADSKKMWQSLETLGAIEAKTLLTGHGEPWHGGVAEAVGLAKAAGQD